AVLTIRQPRRENVPDRTHPLTGGRLREVVVTVPPRLLSRVRDEVEDEVGGRIDVAGRPDHAGNVVGCHGPIKPAQGGATAPTRPTPSHTHHRAARQPITRSGTA